MKDATLTTEISGWLRCPGCHGPVRWSAAEVLCTRCADSWSVRDGIADFTDSGSRAEKEKFGAYRTALPELARVALREGWLEALQEVIRPLPGIGPGMFAYVTDESKGDLLSVMNIEPGDKVLDLGCGLGAVSVAVARWGADCHVIDISHEQVAFAAIRCRQSGFPDVKAACAGDDMKLPLADDHLDAIIMNGVLEWVGCAERYGGSADDAQLTMLREAHRVLRPRGQLYVASRNLYSLLHLLGGRPDHVTKLPYIGMLPPRIQLLLVRGSSADSGARIHGLGGYRRLFDGAGFRQKGAYALMPDFRHPKRFIPLGQRVARGFKGPGSRDIYNRRLEGMLARVLPHSLLKRLVYCYGFLLQKK